MITASSRRCALIGIATSGGDPTKPAKVKDQRREDKLMGIYMNKINAEHNECEENKGRKTDGYNTFCLKL